MARDVESASGSDSLVHYNGNADCLGNVVIAGFFTGGALAVRGGVKAARNSAIMCACFLAVIEGVGIGFQRMMAENTRLDVSSHIASTDPSLAR